MRRTLAGLQVAGGLVGFGIGAWLFPQFAAATEASLTALALHMLGPPVLALAAGLLWWWDYKLGAVLSVLLWVLQVPVLSSATLGYFFNVGLGWRWMWGPEGLSNYLFLGTQWHWALHERAAGPTIGVNVVALGVVAVLLGEHIRQQLAMPPEAMPAPARDSA